LSCKSVGLYVDAVPMPLGTRYRLEELVLILLVCS
jgi:hypothetical protein